MTVIQGWCSAAVFCVRLPFDMLSEKSWQQNSSSPVQQWFLNHFCSQHSIPCCNSTLKICSQDSLWDNGGWLVWILHLPHTMYVYVKLFLTIYNSFYVQKYNIHWCTTTHTLGTTARGSSLHVHWQNLPCIKGRKLGGKFHPITRHEGPEGSVCVCVCVV
jgi:hypothetical protein